MTSEKREGRPLAKGAPASPNGNDSQHGTPCTPWLRAHLRRTEALRERDPDRWWQGCVLAGIRTLSATGQPFDAYSLAELGVPEPRTPKAWGAALSAASAQGLIVGVGYGPSRRPTAASSACRIWRGSSAVAA